jgi:hypothetical protein
MQSKFQMFNYKSPNLITLRYLSNDITAIYIFCWFVKYFSYLLVFAVPRTWIIIVDNLSLISSFTSDDLDERLIPTFRLSDYQLTEVALVPSNRSTSRSVSSSDILRLQQLEAVENLNLGDVRRRQFGRAVGTAGSTARSVRINLKWFTQKSFNSFLL